VKSVVMVFGILLSACQSIEKEGGAQHHIFENAKIDKPATNIVRIYAKIPVKVPDNVEVRVGVSVVVDPKGEVVKAEIIKPAKGRYKGFNREVITAIYKWKYRPGEHLTDTTYVRLTETFIWTNKGVSFLK